MIVRQVSTEVEESSESFDELAGVVNDYFRLRQDLIKVEAEVYGFARILQSMTRTRANKFKAQLWEAWDELQQIIVTFAAIVLNEKTV